MGNWWHLRFCFRSKTSGYNHKSTVDFCRRVGGAFRVRACVDSDLQTVRSHTNDTDRIERRAEHKRSRNNVKNTKREREIQTHVVFDIETIFQTEVKNIQDQRRSFLNRHVFRKCWCYNEKNSRLFVLYCSLLFSTLVCYS